MNESGGELKNLIVDALNEFAEQARLEEQEEAAKISKSGCQHDKSLEFPLCGSWGKADGMSKKNQSDYRIWFESQFGKRPIKGELCKFIERTLKIEHEAKGFRILLDETSAYDQKFNDCLKAWVARS